MLRAEIARERKRGVKQGSVSVAIAAGSGRLRSKISLGKEACNADFARYPPDLAFEEGDREDGMKIVRITATMFVSAAAFALIFIAPALAADPFGTWLTGDKKGKVRIVNCSGALCGSLVWLQEPIDPDTNQPKTDKHNVDAGKRGRPLLGVPIVLDMKPNGANTWQGQVYNAEDGNTYTGSFTLTGANSAELKGCIMGGLICKAQTWTRTN
jgi:uncharacterized protein (DUF2147 family)